MQDGAGGPERDNAPFAELWVDDNAYGRRLAKAVKGRAHCFGFVPYNHGNRADAVPTQQRNVALQQGFAGEIQQRAQTIDLKNLPALIGKA